jgi:hypothetical protein
MELQSVIPWGRTLAEYQAMFLLTPEDRDKSILGCGDGPASFNAEWSELGGRVISVDPIYQFDQQAIRNRISEVYDEILSKMESDHDRYDWDDIPSVQALGILRMKAMNRFLEDYVMGSSDGRYRMGQLPNLDFADDSFELALCSHYLFLYSQHVDCPTHLQSLLELARISAEVRIYPLVTLEGTPSPYLDPVMESLISHGLKVHLKPVPYRFQKGAHNMLVIER